MTIYFNPCYDSSVFLTEKDCGLGKTYSGKDALLSELELRAGLTGANAEHIDRVIAYMEAMRAAGRLCIEQSLNCLPYCKNQEESHPTCTVRSGTI